MSARTEWKVIWYSPVRAQECNWSGKRWGIQRTSIVGVHATQGLQGLIQKKLQRKPQGSWMQQRWNSDWIDRGQDKICIGPHSHWWYGYWGWISEHEDQVRGEKNVHWCIWPWFLCMTNWRSGAEREGRGCSPLYNACAYWYMRMSHPCNIGWTWSW